MNGFSNVVIMGALVRDPELKFLPSGKECVNITVAINSSYKSESGEKKESTAFVDCVSFGKQAAAVAQFFKKGRSILVSGKLRQDNWEDKTTHQKRSKLDVLIDSFSFVDSKQDGAAGAPQAEQAAPAQPGSAPAPAPTEDDPVPF